MKIKITSGYFDKNEYRSIYLIEVNGIRKFRALEGEPEDANMSRDFNDIYTIPDLMKMSYEAGKKGEEFEIEDVEYKED